MQQFVSTAFKKGLLFIELKKSLDVAFLLKKELLKICQFSAKKFEANNSRALHFHET